MEKTSRIAVLGANGMVGRALVRRLKVNGYFDENVISITRKDVDLTKQDEVEVMFGNVQPEYVFLAAAKVGGIHANNVMPAEFIYNNLAIQTNVIHACKEYSVKKLCFLGSVCIYPKFAEVPVKEESLLTGELEPTNQWYATAKIAGPIVSDRRSTLFRGWLNLMFNVRPMQ